MVLAFNTHVHAQPSQVIQVDLGQTNELQSTCATVWVRNTMPYPQFLDSVQLSRHYGHQPFTMSWSADSVPPGDSVALNGCFQAWHNTTHVGGAILHWADGQTSIIVLKAQGTYSNTYYSNTRNKSQEDLKSALHQIISSPYRSQSYRHARDEMYADIDNDKGEVTCVYTGRRARFNTRQGANANSFNCEHTWPQSLFNSNSPMRSDIHHLFPTDVNANSQRGSLPFGVVQGNPSWQEGGSKKGGGVFEPRDAYKGDCARAMLYFVLRYEDYDNFLQSQESTLRQWHTQYPPNQSAKERNTAIADLQQNRNPFIDYPQFEERIASFSGKASEQPSYQTLLGLQDVLLPPMSSRDTVWISKALFNAGNQDLVISALSVVEGDAFISQANQLPITLKAGEGLVLRLSMLSQNDSLFANIAYATNDPAAQNGSFSISGAINSSAQQAEGDRHWTVYPNPTSGTFYIDAAHLIPHTSVELFNLQGERMQLQASGTKLLHCANCSAGVFWLRLRNETGTVHKKLIIQ